MARPPGLGYSGSVPTAGIIVIGNEVLSGKVTDTNSPYLCRELRALGVDVERILTIPDVVEVIASEVRAMSDAYDFVFTSGGIGPTHDDLTMEGVARAFGRELALSPSIAGRIERAQARAPNESQLKMAMIPAGASLVDAGDLWFPVVIVDNVYVLPGVPELLMKKFASVRDRFRGEPFLLKNVYVKRRESEIAASLNELLAEFPELLLGSYPKIGEEDFHVLLTLESRDAAYLGQALESLLRRLAPGAVHKVE
jgi:FAD synthetase